jgi:hypothetical protein
MRSEVTTAPTRHAMTFGSFLRYLLEVFMPHREIAISSADRNQADPNGIAEAVLNPKARRLYHVLDERRTGKYLVPEGGMLSSAQIMAAVTRLMWAQRGGLDIATAKERRADHGYGCKNTKGRTTEIRIPGGMVIRMNPAPDGFDPIIVTTPDGGTSKCGPDENDAAGALFTLWRTMQAEVFEQAIGIARPDVEDTGRPDVAAQDRVEDFVMDMIVRNGLTTCAVVKDTLMTASQAKRCEEKRVQASAWSSFGVEDIYLREYQDNYGDDPAVQLISHERYGDFAITHGKIAIRNSRAFEAALGSARELPEHLPMPRGNAQAARVLRLCREAVAAEPDLVDASGNRIAPLVEKHLPSLMRRHAEASLNAATKDLAAIDEELTAGIEIVRSAVDEALRVSSVARRDALRTELRFLETRHPDHATAQVGAALRVA